MNFFKKIKEGLTKTRTAVVENIRGVVGTAKIDDDMLDRIEEILITADLGVDTSMELVEKIRQRTKRQALHGDQILPALREELDTIIRDAAVRENDDETDEERPHPFVTFVVGVNGTGKTTSIGKLAKHFINQGESVLIVAADTFRTAAVEQVAIWAERTGADIVRGATGADPASVVFDGLSAAVSRGVDRVLVDTAGRLHNKTNLMNELGKLDRVAKKVMPDAPHEVLLVLDGTTGQNGLSQARHFMEVSGVTALVVTKLDGTAKGGVLVPIGRELDIPVRWVGVGEGIDDLVPFSSNFVVEAVFGDDASIKIFEEKLETEDADSSEEDGESVE